MIPRLRIGFLPVPARAAHLAQFAHPFDTQTRPCFQAHHKRVSASLPELCQQKHGIQMGHVTALGIEFRCPVHGVLQDAEELRCDLFPACRSRFNSGPREAASRSFELAQDLGYFHAKYPITLLLRGAGASVAPWSRSNTQ